MLWEVRGRLQCNSVEEILDSRELESRSEMQGADARAATTATAAADDDSPVAGGNAPTTPPACVCAASRATGTATTRVAAAPGAAVSL